MLINADALHIPLADKSVHCIVTSPPYWALRNYGVDGQLGLENTLEEYIANMVAVFREVWRVLRDDGTLWMNLGDAYAANQNGGGSVFDNGRSDGRKFYEGDKSRGREKNLIRIPPGLKSKDLIGIPWRVAFALQADGWYLRSDIIWAKPNPMPESVKDRPTKSHEYLFLLTKKARYYYDVDAVREANKPESENRYRYSLEGSYTPGSAYPNESREKPQQWSLNPAGRNRRTVWTIPTVGYPGAHFATFPPALVEPCVKAGTSERGCCPVCGKGWVRIVKTTGGTIGKGWTDHSRDKEIGMAQTNYMRIGSQTDEDGNKYQRFTLGWKPDCACGADPVPCTVFDPFGGSGTTALVARKLGRRAVIMDISMPYLHLAKKRLGLDIVNAWEKGSGIEVETEAENELPLFNYQNT